MRVAVAMSGGVDSAVAALLLQRQGYDVVGMSMHLYNLDLPDTHRFDTCCSLADLDQARRVADDLGFPHFVVDYTADFNDAVVQPFIAAYAAGETPNPCVRCNDRIKFRPLLDHADRLGCSHLATGHYARIDWSAGRATLARARDRRKDQSYFLFGLSAEALARTLFPVGDLTKDEVRALADEAGLAVARKPESQDICFIPDGNLAGFLDERVGVARPGAVVDETGRELARHDGIHRFTVGQRKGTGVAVGRALYVGEIRPQRAEVVVAPRERVLRGGLIARDVYWVHGAPVPAPRLDVQLRYRGAPIAARVESAGERAAVRFLAGRRDVVSPGQAVVFYDGDRVLGGGWIQQPLE